MEKHRKIGFFTDPHIGFRRVGNTTPTASRKFRLKVFHAAEHAVLRCREEADTVVCLGDLFDTYTNDESTILQGLAIAKQCDMVIGGNHDITARADSVSSLDLVEEAGQGEVFVSRAPYNQAFVDYFQAEAGPEAATCGVFTIPHVTTQELFEQSLEEAKRQAQDCHDLHKVLLLHCNYDMRFEVTETSLVLMKEQARELLEAGFDYVMLGHEHIPTNDFDGRLIVLGNTLPLTMGEVGPRRFAVLDFVSGEMVFHELPSLTRLNIEDAASKLTDEGNFMLDTPDTGSVAFIHITGEVASEDFARTQRAIRKLWNEFPDLVSLKNQISLKGAATRDRDTDVIKLVPLQDRIRDDLKESPELLKVYDEILQSLSQ